MRRREEQAKWWTMLAAARVFPASMLGMRSTRGSDSVCEKKGQGKFALGVRVVHRGEDATSPSTAPTEDKVETRKSDPMDCLEVASTETTWSRKYAWISELTEQVVDVLGIRPVADS